MRLKTYLLAALFFIFLLGLGWYLYIPPEEMNVTFPEQNEYVHEMESKALRETTELLCRQMFFFNLTKIEAGYYRCYRLDDRCICISTI